MEQFKEMGFVHQMEQAIENGKVPRTVLTRESLSKFISDAFFAVSKNKVKLDHDLINELSALTDKELENIPHGLYNFGGFWTGKGGAINFVKTLKQEMVNAKLHC